MWTGPLTEETVALLAGLAVGLLWARAVTCARPLLPPPELKLCSAEWERPGWPVHLRSGTAYVFDRRVRCWLVFLLVLPLAIGLRLYALLGLALVFVVRGLWYDDRFDFTGYDPVAKTEADDGTAQDEEGKETCSTIECVAEEDDDEVRMSVL